MKLRFKLPGLHVQRSPKSKDIWRWDWGPFRQHEIFCTPHGDVYLRRWGLALPFGYGIYLHHFIRGDVPVFHDHPWDFISIVVKGAYVETTCGHREDEYHQAMTQGVVGYPRQRLVRALGWVRHRAEDLHYIDRLCGDTWSIVLRGPKRRKWGLIEELKGWKNWVAYRIEHGYADPSKVKPATAPLPSTYIDSMTRR